MGLGSAGLVDIVREFLTAHRLMSRLVQRFHRGELRFAELQELIGDDEDSVLFRLKERCHAQFRAGDVAAPAVRHQEILFDLAVGSLFHEAMKLREDFYQREVYGPRMRELRMQAGEDADALFGEFERILSAVSLRIDEVLHEVEALFLRTREQLRLLLIASRENGHVIRLLLEHRALAEEVFSENLDSLLDEVRDSSADAYAFAGRSYLVSGYFGEAERAFAEAIARDGPRAELERLCSYARGMRAYVAGNYAECIMRLEQWVEGQNIADSPLSESARSAIARIGELANESGSEEVKESSRRLLKHFADVPGPLSQASVASGRR